MLHILAWVTRLFAFRWVFSIIIIISSSRSICIIIIWMPYTLNCLICWFAIQLTPPPTVCCLMTPNHNQVLSVYLLTCYLICLLILTIKDSSQLISFHLGFLLHLSVWSDNQSISSSTKTRKWLAMPSPSSADMHNWLLEKVLAVLFLFRLFLQWLLLIDVLNMRIPDWLILAYINLQNLHFPNNKYTTTNKQSR